MSCSAFQQVERSHQILARKLLRQPGQLDFTFGQIALAGAGRIDDNHHHVADHLGQLADDEPQVVASFDRTVRQREAHGRLRQSPPRSSNSESRPTSPSTVATVVW